MPGFTWINETKYRAVAEGAVYLGIERQTQQQGAKNQQRQKDTLLVHCFLS